MADPINDLLANIKTSLHAAVKAGELKDVNLTVKNVFDFITDSSLMRQNLPLIQYEDLSIGGGGYIADAIERIPFAIRFICWIDGRREDNAAKTRARNLRDKLIDSLHTRRPFGNSGAARQRLTIEREQGTYWTKNAIGIGVTYSGDLWLTPG